MSKPVENVTDAELAVLDALWQRSRATVRELTDELYPGGSETHYATVKKLLERLEQKACVDRDRSQSVHQFFATIERDDLIGRRLGDVAADLCNGSVTPLVMHLVSRGRLSKGDLKSLRELIDRLEKSPKGRQKKAPGQN